MLRLGGVRRARLRLSVTVSGNTFECLVILDSDHSEAHVRAELAAYAPLVPVGSYVIVEDTNVHGHPALPAHGPGRMEALDDFLASTDDFAIDEGMHKFLPTFNPRGYLRRIA